MRANRFWMLFILITVSILASLFIALHGNWQKIPVAFRSPNFWIAVITSFILSVCIIVVIYKIGQVLDKDVKWKQNMRRRTLLQIIFGIILPALADLVLISFYFELLGTDLIESQFLLIDFPVVVSFIIVVNFIFLVRDLLQPYSTNKKEQSSIPHLLTIQYKRVKINFNVPEDILYFYRSGRKIIILTAKGREYPVEMSISTLKEQYEKTGFLQINRALIINSKIVKTYTSPSDIKRNTLIVVFKSQYLSAIENPESNRFEITGGYLNNFKKKLEEN